MDSDFDAEKSDAFISAALARKLLTDHQVETLRRESAEKSLTPAQLAIESGMMKPIEAEIAEAFAAPKEMAPGFELLDVLGYGGLGVVYRAHQPHLERDVAIKAILQSRLVEQNVAARFHQEGAAIGRLQHPNIVSAFDSGSHNRRLYLVMELVRGIDLRQQLDQQGAIDVATSLSIIRQTASGLAHAYAQGIIHRDIKPGNLILTDAPAGYDLPPGVPLVKIADFGLARLSAQADAEEDVTRLTMTGAALGTPMFCAPEQLSGDPVDHRADIYALGATLVNMLAGKPPLKETSVSKLITAKLTGKKYDADLLPPNLPAEVRTLIDEMMAADPDDRIDSYQLLIERIDRLQGGTAATAPGRAVGIAGDGKKRLIRIGGIALILLVLVATVSLAMRQGLFAAPDPVLVQTGWQQPLFDGQDVDLLSQSGLWSRGTDAEGGVILQGSNGSWAKAIPTPPDAQQGIADAVAMSVGIDLQEAGAAEVHFGFVQQDFDNARRFVVRYDRQQVVLGTRDGLKGDFRPRGEPLRLPETSDSDGPQYQYIRVEQQAGYWYVFFNNEIVGSLRSDPDAANRFVQLVAPSGKVHFEDIHTFGLRAPDE